MQSKIKSILDEKRCIPNLVTERRLYYLVLKKKEDIEKLNKDLIEAYEQVCVPNSEGKVPEGKLHGYRVKYDIEKDYWDCDCRGFVFHGNCSHIESAKAYSKNPYKKEKVKG